MTDAASAVPVPESSTARAAYFGGLSPQWAGPVLAVLQVASLALIPALDVYLVFGLPAHVLLLHVPVILVPLVAVASVVAVWKTSWRRRYGLALAISGVVTSVATIVTVSVGQTFRDRLFGGDSGDPSSFLSRHAEAAEKLRISVWLFAAVLIASLVLDRVRAERAGTVDAPGNVLTRFIVPGIVSVLAVVSLGLTMYTGHLGAEAAWKDRVTAGAGGHGFGGPPPSGTSSGQGSPPAG